MKEFIVDIPFLENFYDVEEDIIREKRLRF